MSLNMSVLNAKAQNLQDLLTPTKHNITNQETLDRQIDHPAYIARFQ